MLSAITANDELKQLLSQLSGIPVDDVEYAKVTNNIF